LKERGSGAAGSIQGGVGGIKGRGRGSGTAGAAALVVVNALVAKAQTASTTTSDFAEQARRNKAIDG